MLESRVELVDQIEALTELCLVVLKRLRQQQSLHKLLKQVEPLDELRVVSEFLNMDIRKHLRVELDDID